MLQADNAVKVARSAGKRPRVLAQTVPYSWASIRKEKNRSAEELPKSRTRSRIEKRYDGEKTRSHLKLLGPLAHLRQDVAVTEPGSLL